MRLENSELVSIKGGFNFSPTLLNAFARVVSTLYNVGQAFGSFVNRHFTKRYC